MNHLRTSIIWKISKKKLQKMVQDAHTLMDILRQLELDGKGRHHKVLKQRLQEDKINFSHIPLGLNHAKGRYVGGGIPLKPIDKVLIKKGTIYHNQSLKRRLIREKILENKCAVCGLPPIWNGRPLTLQLDHINGDRTDYRLNNIRLICPNCHVQTDTIAYPIKFRQKQ